MPLFPALESAPRVVVLVGLGVRVFG